MDGNDLLSAPICFSVSPRRQAHQRLLFAAAGLRQPLIYPHPYFFREPTRGGKPARYSAHSITMQRALFRAIERDDDLLFIVEDDAAPKPHAAEELSTILRNHPLPADCGILCLGDINGESTVRGVETLTLDKIDLVYTPLRPGFVENKGSHAFVIFKDAFMPYIRGLQSCDTSDLALSRICRYSDLRAYALFKNPLFAQLHSTHLRLPELYHEHPVNARSAFITTSPPLLPPLINEVFIFSNCPTKDKSVINQIFEDATDQTLIIHLNKAVDMEQLEQSDTYAQKMLICRTDANKHNHWFTPDDTLLPATYNYHWLPTEAELKHELTGHLNYPVTHEPSTGFCAYLLAKKHYPSARISLVDFDPTGYVGTYKWSKHHWEYEAAIYAAENVNIIKTRP